MPTAKSRDSEASLFNVFYEFKAEASVLIAHTYGSAVGLHLAGPHATVRLYCEIHKPMCHARAKPQGAYQLLFKQFKKKESSCHHLRVFGRFHYAHRYLWDIVASNIAAAKLEHRIP